MADDKGASSGSEWSAFEIIVAILLGIVLLSYITKRPIVPLVSDAPSDSPSVIAEPENNNTCGLTVTNPKPLQKVSGTITLSGRVTGCQWYAANGIALYAQAIDDRGKPVTAYSSVMALGLDKNSHASFSTTLKMTRTPASGVGYLILVPAATQMSNVVDTGSTSVTARIPIKF